jgi:hypothetical protein
VLTLPLSSEDISIYPRLVKSLGVLTLFSDVYYYGFLVGNVRLFSFFNF